MVYLERYFDVCVCCLTGILGAKPNTRPSHYLFIPLRKKFVYLYMYLKGRKEEIFHLLVHSLDDYNSQVWTTLILGASNSIWVFHMGVRVPSIRAIVFCLPRHISRELNWKSSSQDTNQHSGILNWISNIGSNIELLHSSSPFQVVFLKAPHICY